MKHFPMIFNSEMAKALLDGRKTVTRRPISESVLLKLQDAEQAGEIHSITEPQDKSYVLSFAPVKIGDLIWVRETWGVISHAFDENGNFINWTPDRPALPIKELKHGKGYYTGHAIYRADGEMRWCNDFEEEISAWHPSIHMPKAASRMTLKVTDVRVERVKEIKPCEVKKEGFNDWSGFAFTWSSIYLSRGLGWDNNPYVWVIEFQVINQNINKLEG